MPVPSPTPPSKRVVFGLAVAAVLLYAPTLGWGLPEATAADRTKTHATDSILPLEALAEMHNTFIVSKPDRNYGYPWWHYCVVAGAQAPYLAWLGLTGNLTSARPTYPFGLADPVTALRGLALIGRLVSLLMAAGLVVATYLFARELFDEPTARAAAALTLLCYPLFYYSGTGNLDAPAAFWTAGGLAVWGRILARGLSPRRAAWLGVFAALAIATKDQAVVVFAPLGLALLLPAASRVPESGGRARMLALGLGASLGVYAIATGLWVDPQRHWTHLHALLFEPDRITVASAYFPPEPLTSSGLATLGGQALARAADVFSPAVWLAFAVGVARAARAFPLRLLALLPLASLLGLFAAAGYVVLRYYLPLVPVVDAFAAYGVLGLRQTVLRALWLPLLLVLCAYRAMIGIDLGWAQLHETRLEAGAWLTQHARAGERVEYFGSAQKLPPLSADVVSRRVGGQVLWKGRSGHGAETLAYLRGEGPEYVLLIPDWTTPPGSDHSADCPPEVRAALAGGTAGYREVAHFEAAPLLPHWLARPRLDNPSVAPPVRIFARDDVAARVGGAT